MHSSIKSMIKSVKSTLNMGKKKRKTLDMIDLLEKKGLFKAMANSAEIGHRTLDVEETKKEIEKNIKEFSAFRDIDRISAKNVDLICKLCDRMIPYAKFK